LNLAIPFEDYVFVSGFEAICSYSEGVIEASIRPLSFPSFGWMDRLFRGEDTATSTTTEITVYPPLHSPAQPVLKICAASKEMQTLLGAGPQPRRLSLTISNINVNQNDTAAKVLIRYSDSLFSRLNLFTTTRLSLSVNEDGALLPSVPVTLTNLPRLNTQEMPMTGQRFPYIGMREVLGVCRCFNF
jgi:hypothetical protein